VARKWLADSTLPGNKANRKKINIPLKMEKFAKEQSEGKKA
jgi:hypothetical protein